MFEQDRIASIDADHIRHHASDLDHLAEALDRRGLDAAQVIEALIAFDVAVPSWALGTGGTRFGRFPGGGEPRTTEEKLDDIAAINALTRANGAVSLHVPWDNPDDPGALRQYGEQLGIAFDAMNSNTFQNNPETTFDGEVSYKFGSLASTEPEARRAAVEHNQAVIDLGAKLGSNALTVWLADGTNHPGQADMTGQFERTVEGLQAIHAHLPDGWRMFTEHKPYEPAFYSSVNQDWGSSLLLAQAAGDRASCLVDLGHHLPNANIEQVVARLAMVDRLGGFHFNDSKYGDDDLTTGSIKPFQLFLIFCELLRAGGGTLPPMAYMLDQSHNVKDPLEDLVQSTEALLIAYTQAMLVDREALADAQESNDAAFAQQVLQDAYRTDVRPLLAEARQRQGGALNPLRSFRALGYRQRCTELRGNDAAATGL